MILSTDIAHSLSDAFEVPLGPEPTELSLNLWGQQPDVYYNIERYWRIIQTYVSDLFSWHGLDEVMAEEMTVLPGMDELGNLLWIADHVDGGDYDVIVVDAAPTGETLRLLSMPEASRWWVERIAPIGKRVSRLGGPILQKVIGIPVPQEEDFGPVPVRTVPIFDREMVGFDKLREVGQALFGDDDPSKVYYRGRPYQVQRSNGTYLLTLELPFTSRDEVKLTRHSDELILQVGSWRRTLILPRVLVDAPTRGARMEEQTLKVEFEARARAGRGGKR